MFPQRPARRLARTVALCLSAVFSSCFEPEGEHFVNVGSPVFDGIEINLAQAGTEIYLYKPARISYHIDQGNFQLISIEGFLDGRSLRNPNDPTVIFIDPASYVNGLHDLKIAATFTSYSGTLASAVGRETETITRDFQVMIDLQSPPAISIAKMEARDGSLYVSWNKPEKQNFINYQVHRYVRQSGEWVEHFSTVPWLVSAYKTEFNDSLYAGGDVQYRVDIKGYNYSTTGLLADTTFRTLNPVMEQTGTNTVKISWNPSLFHKNIRELRLSSYNEPDQSLPAEEPVSITREVSFGAVLIHAVIPLMKYSNAYMPTLIRSYVGKELTVEGVTDRNESVLYKRLGNREIMISPSDRPVYVQLVNSATHILEEKVDLTPYYQSSLNPYAADRAQFGMTPNGSALYVSTGTEVIRFDQDLNFVGTLDLTDLYASPFFNIAYSFRFSNNQIGAFLFYTTVRLIDFESGRVIAASLPNTPFDISADGKYFFNNQRLYDISSGSMIEIADLSSSRSLQDVSFNNASSQLFMSYYDGHFAIVDLVSRSVVSSYDFPGDVRDQILIDPISGLCGVSIVDPESNKKELVVFDPSTFSITRKIWVGAPCFLYDNTLYADTRFALPL